MIFSRKERLGDRVKKFKWDGSSTNKIDFQNTNHIQNYSSAENSLQKEDLTFSCIETLLSKSDL